MLIDIINIDTIILQNDICVHDHPLRVRDKYVNNVFIATTDSDDEVIITECKRKI